jgi:hypothetical protein
MTLSQFMQENQVTGFEKVNELILTAEVGEALYGLDVDTSNIPSGIPVERVTEFQLQGNILTIDGIEYNTDEISMLGFEDNELKD